MDRPGKHRKTESSRGVRARLAERLTVREGTGEHRNTESSRGVRAKLAERLNIGEGTGNQRKIESSRKKGAEHTGPHHVRNLMEYVATSLAAESLPPAVKPYAEGVMFAAIVAPYLPGYLRLKAKIRSSEKMKPDTNTENI